MSHADDWYAPEVCHPIRSRISVPESSSGSVDLGVAAAVVSAGLLSSGTVLVRNWPRGAAGDRRLREIWDDMGAYVVASADGLTATSRSTGGRLSGGEWDLVGHTGIAAVIATAGMYATGEVRLHVGDALARRIAQRIGACGGIAEAAGATVAVTPGASERIEWDCRGGWGPAGLVASVRSRVALRRWSEAEQQTPGLTALWLRMLAADEYLMPGSARLPYDYLR